MTHKYFSQIAWTGNRGEGTTSYRSYDRTACHMLWYLHYASAEGIVVTGYEDNPIGIGEVGDGGAGRFASAVLRPKIMLRTESNIAVARAIHDRIHEVCFIARSVNFPVTYEPEFDFMD